MATGNFHNTNASTIFAAGSDENDEFIWEDTRMNISCTLEADWKSKERGYYFSKDNSLRLADELRSYPATSIGTLELDDVCYCGFTVSISLIPKTVFGYYSGFNLDYEIEIEMSSEDGYYSEHDELGNMIDDIKEYGTPHQKGMMKLWGDKFNEKIKEELKKGCDYLEKVFSQFSDSYLEVGRFCNGEAVYEKVA